MTEVKNTLRLLYTTKCNRHCHYCVNDQWNVDKIPNVIRFNHYDEIIITGGEPLLTPRELIGAIKVIKTLTDAKIYVYTAISDIAIFTMVLKYVDGITLSVHTQRDIMPMVSLNHYLITEGNIEGKTLRLNAMRAACEVNDFSAYSIWDVKQDIEPLEECPLPENEVLMKLKELI